MSEFPLEEVKIKCDLFFFLNHMIENRFISFVFFKKSQYDVNGFAVIENFLTEKEADELREAGLKVCKDAPEEDRKVFGKHPKEQYFLDSATRLHYFYESDAFDNDGKLIVDKMRSINKVRNCYSDKLRDNEIHSVYVIRLVMDVIWKIQLFTSIHLIIV